MEQPFRRASRSRAAAQQVHVAIHLNPVTERMHDLQRRKLRRSCKEITVGRCRKPARGAALRGQSPRSSRSASVVSFAKHKTTVAKSPPPHRTDESTTGYPLDAPESPATAPPSPRSSSVAIWTSHGEVTNTSRYHPNKDAPDATLTHAANLPNEANPTKSLTLSLNLSHPRSRKNPLR